MAVKTTKIATVASAAKPAKSQGIITQKELARLAGVNPTTIYNALHRKELVHERTLQKIHQLIEEYDYHPNGIAQAMVRGKTNVLGIVVPTIEVSYYAKLISAIEQITNTIGYNSIICQHLDDVQKEEREVRLMCERRVDGMVIRTSGVTSSSREGAQLCQKLLQMRIPFVLVDRRIEGLDEYFVGMDDHTAVAKLVDYLAARGHRRIAILSWQSTIESSGPRYDGYIEGLKRNNLEFDRELVVFCHSEYAGGREEIHELIRRHGADRPSAIITFNDTTALGAMQGLRELNLRVPQDVAVASVGSYAESMICPLQPFRLTYAAMPLDAIAREAVRMLCSQIEGKGWQRGPILCPGEIRIGDSA